MRFGGPRKSHFSPPNFKTGNVRRVSSKLHKIEKATRNRVALDLRSTDKRTLNPALN